MPLLLCLKVHDGEGCHCGSQGVAGKGHFRASAAAAVEGPSHGVLGDIAYGPIRKVYAKSKPVCTSTSGWPGRRAVVLAGHLCMGGCRRNAASSTSLARLLDPRNPTTTRAWALFRPT